MELVFDYLYNKGEFSMRNMKIIALVAMIGLVSSVAFGGLIVDLRAVSATGTSHVTDAKDVVIGGAGDVITFQVWATVSGSTSIPVSQTFQTAGMNITETVPSGGAVHGDMGPMSLLAYESQFQATSTIPNLLTNAAGDKDFSDTSAGNTWFVNAPAMLDATNPIQLGTITYKVKSILAGGDATMLNIVPTTGTKFAALYAIDNVLKYANTKGGTPSAYLFTAGAPVTTTAIPEPSTLILLGMGVLSLLFIRRRK
jgi:hypothetical protein